MAARAGQAAASEQARAQGIQSSVDFFGNIIDLGGKLATGGVL